MPAADALGWGVKEAQTSIIGAPIVTALAMSEIQTQVQAANKTHSELWLAKALRATFMAYFIKLPDFGAEGLGRAWDALQVVGDRVRQVGGKFHTVAPLEFRFVKGDDSAMSGAYSKNPDDRFINIEVIGFVDNPNFRAFWYGTHKLYLNALFFGQVLEATEKKKHDDATSAQDHHH